MLPRLLLSLPFLAAAQLLPAQNQAFNTFGSALAAEASFNQGGFRVERTCNGLNAGPNWVVAPNEYDGWAVAGSPAQPRAAWAFRGGARTVQAMQLLSNYGFAAQYGLHYINDFTIAYTQDPSPTLAGSTWTAVSVQSLSVPGGSFIQNRVTYPTSPLPNLADLRVTFAPVLATAVRLLVVQGTGLSGNIVLTEVSFDTSLPTFVNAGTGAGCAGTMRLSVNGPATLGSNDFAWQSWGAPAGSLGVLFFGGSLLPQAVPVLGFDLWLNPSGAVGVTNVANSWGNVETLFPLPAQPSLAGFVLAGQGVWLQGCGSSGLVATDGGAVTLQ